MIVTDDFFVHIASFLRPDEPCASRCERSIDAHSTMDAMLKRHRTGRDHTIQSVFFTDRCGHMLHRSDFEEAAQWYGCGYGHGYGHGYGRGHRQGMSPSCFDGREVHFLFNRRCDGREQRCRNTAASLNSRLRVIQAVPQHLERARMTLRTPKMFSVH